MHLTTSGRVAWAVLPAGEIIYRYFSAQWDGLLKYSRSGSAPDTVLRFQYSAPEVEMTGDPSAGTMRMTMNPLAVMPAWAVLEDGRIAVGTTDSYRISVYEPNGDLERVVTLPAARRAMEPADREAIEDLWDQRQRDRGVPDQIRDAISLALPDSYPTFASFAAGPNGTLWVQQIAGPEEMDPEGLGEMSYALLGSRTWDVFDVEGRYLGPIIFPRKLRLLRTIGDFVYGVAQGDFDEDRIIKFRVLGFRMLGEPRSP